VSDLFDTSSPLRDHMDDPKTHVDAPDDALPSLEGGVETVEINQALETDREVLLWIRQVSWREAKYASH